MIPAWCTFSRCGGLALLPATLRRRVSSVRQSIRVLERRLTRLPQTTTSLVGKHTLFSDMADWNPAEMLGPRPAKLDVSLYRLLITSGAWNTGRVSLGYTDVRRRRTPLGARRQTVYRRARLSQFADAGSGAGGFATGN